MMSGHFHRLIMMNVTRLHFDQSEKQLIAGHRTTRNHCLLALPKWQQAPAWMPKCCGPELSWVQSVLKPLTATSVPDFTATSSSSSTFNISDFISASTTYTSPISPATMPKCLSTCCKKVYNPTSTDNFNSSCLIPVIFGIVITDWV